jgi:predicted nucleic acid-binding protein
MTGKRGWEREPRWVLDSGGVSALLGRSREARDRMRYVTDSLQDVEIPAAVLVECATGDSGRDAELNRVLGVVIELAGEITNIDEAVARRAGRLRFRARTDDGIDAMVAACAMGDGSPAVLLTSDPDDLQRLLSRERNVTIRKV